MVVVSVMMLSGAVRRDESGVRRHRLDALADNSFDIGQEGADLFARMAVGLRVVAAGAKAAWTGRPW
jgi:hypothetical protein